MSRQLVLVHGRSQQDKEPGALKAEWLEALDAGLARSGLSLPIDEADVRFPYYGDTLQDLTKGATPDAAAEVVVRGNGDPESDGEPDEDERRFLAAVLEEVRLRSGITEEQLASAGGEDVIERGPLDWQWVRATLRAVDRYIPHGSGTTLALATRDVFHYLSDPDARNTIDAGVRSALTPEREAVVVGHSLGSVVAYRVLRDATASGGLRIPLFLTVGSPLGVTEIRKRLKRSAIARTPEVVQRWHNAMDIRDVVALYPLTPQHFPLNPVEPGIENSTNVKNRTANRHGISGYLDDPGVAKLIYDGLVG